MKITFASILNPVTETTSHVITGFLPTGELVQISRHLNHWKVNLKIVVGGFIWHDSEPSAAEQVEFDNLRSRALNDKCEKQDKDRDEAMRAASYAFAKA